MLITLFARLGGKVINFVIFLVLARGLNVEELGWFGFVYTASFIITSAFDIGVRNSVAYYIGKSPGDLRALTSLVLLLWAFHAGLATVALFIVLHTTADALSQPEFFLPAAVLVCSLLFMRMGQGVLLGQGRIVFFNQTELIARAVLAVATIGIVVLDQLTLRGALWAYAVSQLASAVTLALGLIPYTERIGKREFDLGVKLLRRGVEFVLGVMLMLGAKRGTLMLLSQLGTAEELGTFYGLERFTEIITEAATAIAVVVFSQNVRAGTDAEAVASAAQSTRLSLAVFVCLAVVMGLCAEWLVPLMLGESYAGGAAMFRVLLIGTLAASIWTILFPSLSAIASPRLAIIVFLPNVALSLVLTWLFYQVWGIIGAAWAFGVSHAALSAAFIAVYWVKYSVPVAAFLVPTGNEIVKALRRIWQKLHGSNVVVSEEEILRP